MALPNSNWSRTLISDATIRPDVPQRIMEALEIIADVFGVDYSSAAQTVQVAMASFDTTDGLFTQFAAIGEETDNGIVIKDATNDLTWRIRADASTALNKIIFEYKDGLSDSYTTAVTITNGDIYDKDGNPLTFIGGITAGTGLTGGGTNGVVTLAVDDGGIDTTQLGASSVTNAKVATDADISGTKLGDASVSPTRIDAGASGLAIITNGTTASFGQIGTNIEHIAGWSVTTDKLASGSVGSRAIASNSIDAEAKVSPDGGDSGEVLTVSRLVGYPVWFELPSSGVFAGGNLCLAESYDVPAGGAPTQETWYVQKFDGDVFDDDGMHDPTTDSGRQIIIQEAGYYQIRYSDVMECDASIPGDDSWILGVRIRKNQSSNIAIKYYDGRAADAVSPYILGVKLDATAYLAVDDEIEIEAYREGTDLSCTASGYYSQFSVRKIG
jgi:hypothetical protein